jgi:hypothetical protein
MEGKIWKYDPCHIISNQRVAINFSPCVDHADLEIERLANKGSWAEIQEIL